MKFWEQPRFKDNYPEYLTKQEKADIKSALLKKFENSTMRLSDYLVDIKVLNDYPEKDQH